MSTILFLCASVSLVDGATLTIRDAIERGLANNRALKAQEAARDAQRSSVDAARSAYLPKLLLSESVTTSTIPSRAFMMKLDQGSITAGDFSPGAMNDPSRKTDFATMLILRQPLFDKGISTTLAIAQKGDQAAEELLGRQREEMAMAIFRGYVEVRRAKERLAAAEEVVKAAREQLRLASVRVREGAGLKSDELRARTWLSTVEQQRIAAGNRLELAKRELVRLMGEPPETSIDPTDEPIAFSLPLDRTRLVEEAISRRRDIRSREEELYQAEIQVERARGEWYPTLHATAGYQMNGNDFFLSRDKDGWFAGATLSWELFDGMRRSAAVERALKLRESTRQSLAEFRSLVALQVERAILTRDEAGKRLEVARHALLDAEEGARLIRARYQNSLSLFIELLDAESNLASCRAELADAEAAFAIAGADLLHASGIFLSEVLK